jgi:hypothetical protein
MDGKGSQRGRLYNKGQLYCTGKENSTLQFANHTYIRGVWLRTSYLLLSYIGYTFLLVYGAKSGNIPSAFSRNLMTDIGNSSQILNLKIPHFPQCQLEILCTQRRFPSYLLPI